MQQIISIFEKYIVFVLYACVFVFTVIQGPQFQPDSGSYELGSIIRIGMYPLTIALFKAIFKTYAFELLILFQVTFTLFAINGLTKFLRKQFDLSFWVYFTTVLFFLFPSVTNGCEYFIVSESLAYPLFLLSLLFFFKFVVTKKNMDGLIFAVALFCLCFARQQFVFFYVVAFIYGSYVFIFEKKFKSARNIIIISVISLATFFISERAYHYTFQGNFSGTPFAGTQLLMRPLFIASNNALKSITEPKQRMFIDELVAELIKKEICVPDEPHKELYLYEHYYNTIYHKISKTIWLRIWGKAELEKEFNKPFSDFEVFQEIDKNMLNIGMLLVKNNFLNFSKYYLKDVIRGMGGYFSVIMLGIISIFCLITVLLSATANNNIYIFTLLSVLMHLGNSALVCLFEPPLTRYTYMTGAILSVMVLILLEKLFCNSEHEKICAES